MEIILSTAALSAGYDGKIIVDDVDISVTPGEILTMIGPNGAGKSTVLKTIIRRLEAISGSVSVMGSDIRSLSRNALARTLSSVMTDRTRPELMSCREVIEAGRYPYTGQLGILSEKDKAAVSEAMELTQTVSLADCDFSRISDGQRQRVLLARAICQEPRILILDEPTSFLDIRHKTELLDLLRELVRAKNIAVIMSIHELDLAQKISDRVLCISDGKAKRCGTPDEIFSDGCISRLYGIDRPVSGIFGSAELKAPEGETQVFVIAGGGSGTHVFRDLQRKGVPFAAGVIHENDADYFCAASLAAVLISEQAFEPVSREKAEEAIRIMDSCGKVICACSCFGTMNSENKRLLEYAVEKNYIIMEDSNG